MKRFAIIGLCSAMLVGYTSCSSFKQMNSSSKRDGDDVYYSLNDAKKDRKLEQQRQEEERKQKEAEAKQRSRSEVLSQATKPLEVRKLKSEKEPAFHRGSIRTEAKDPSGRRTIAAL